MYVCIINQIKTNKKLNRGYEKFFIYAICYILYIIDIIRYT